MSPILSRHDGGDVLADRCRKVAVTKRVAARMVTVGIDKPGAERLSPAWLLRWHRRPTGH